MDGFRLTNLCIELDFGCANAHAKAVLVALAMSFNEENEEVWVGVDTLVRRSACTRNTVFKALSWLEERGLIVKRRTQRSNHYRFNVELIQSGVLQGMKTKTLHSIKTNTPQESQSIKSNTPQSMKANTLQSMRSNTRTNKEQIKEQIINLNTGDISSCFGRFGQNPVSAPTSWEPDEEDVYDIPLRQQLAMSRKIEVDVNDTNHIPTASEIVVLAATLGYRLTHNAALDEIASRKKLTTGMLKEAIQRTKDNTGGIGYLVRILQNASKDPDAFNGIRRAPVVTAETITEAQCRSFAFKAVNAGCLAYAGESHQEAIARVEKRLKDPNYFNRNRQTLERLGLIQGAQA